MKTRDAVLLYQNTETDTKEEKIDLDIVEPISALEIEVESTNGATSNEDNFISDIVTKIEIVDGSEVHESLNMSQLEAIHFYKTLQTPALFPSEWAGGTQRHNAMLFFGRWLWDREYNYSAIRYKNPQLKITFNKAAIRAASATGFATGDNIKLSVIAKVFTDIPAASKFLMHKQINSFTSVSSGEKRIELPTDHIYKQILCRFWKEGSDIDEIISDIKLTMDTDSLIPFNRKTRQLDAEALSTFGYTRIKHDVLRANSGIVRLLNNKEPDYTPKFWSNAAGRMVNIINPWSSQVTIGLFTDATTADTTARSLTGVETGHALHATLPIPFGDQWTPEDWFDPRNYRKMELVLTQAVADATCEIVTEQVRPA